MLERWNERSRALGNKYRSTFRKLESVRASESNPQELRRAHPRVEVCRTQGAPRHDGVDLSRWNAGTSGAERLENTEAPFDDWKVSVLQKATLENWRVFLSPKYTFRESEGARAPESNSRILKRLPPPRSTFRESANVRTLESSSRILRCLPPPRSTFRGPANLRAPESNPRRLQRLPPPRSTFREPANVRFLGNALRESASVGALGTPSRIG